MRVLAVAAVLATIALGGCASGYNVLYRDPLTSLSGQRVAVAPVAWEAPIAGRLAATEWRGPTTQADSARRASLEARWSREFQTRVARRVDGAIVAEPGAFRVEPHIRFLDPWFYPGMTADQSRIELDALIVAPGGRVVDEVQMRELVPGDYWDPSRPERVGHAIDRLADRYARYLDERVRTR